MYTIIDENGHVSTILSKRTSARIWLAKYDNDIKKGECLIYIFIDHNNRDKNFVIIDKNNIPDLDLKDIYKDVGYDFIQCLQNKHNLKYYYLSYYTDMPMAVFEPITKIKKVSIVDSLNINKPAWNRASDNFTFAFLKDVFKALGMSGYSSKSKEDLLDEILTRFTEDAINNKPDINTSVVMQEQNIRRQKKLKTENIDTYNEAVSIASRLVGKNLYMGKKDPLPDIYSLEATYYLVDFVDPYDGLDQFLDEQKKKE